MSAVERAIHKGAIFEQFQGKWIAVLRKRGRALPIATFVGETKDAAAELYLRYVGDKEWNKSKAIVGSPIRLQRLPTSST